MKNNRAFFEHLIFERINQDSKNTPHFNYKVNFEEGGITLELYTYNPIHTDTHYLHTTKGLNPVDCLNQMVNYLDEYSLYKKEKNSYTLTWRKKDDDKNVENVSYYYLPSEEVVRKKFLTSKDVSEYIIISVKLNPYA